MGKNGNYKVGVVFKGDEIANGQFKKVFMGEAVYAEFNTNNQWEYKNKSYALIQAVAQRPEQQGDAVYLLDKEKQAFRRELNQPVDKIKTVSERLRNHQQGITPTKLEIGKNTVVNGQPTMIKETFAVQELLGGTLETTIEEQGVDENTFFAKMYDLFCSLTRLHRRGHIHGDLKPANIFYKKGELILGDLDFADANTGPEVTTPTYMTNKALEKGTSDFKKEDIFALGRILEDMIDKTLLDERWNKGKKKAEQMGYIRRGLQANQLFPEPVLQRKNDKVPFLSGNIWTEVNKLIDEMLDNYNTKTMDDFVTEFYNIASCYFALKGDINSLRILEEKALAQNEAVAKIISEANAFVRPGPANVGIQLQAQNLNGARKEQIEQSWNQYKQGEEQQRQAEIQFVINKAREFAGKNNYNHINPNLKAVLNNIVEAI